MTNEELLSVAEIVERLSARFHEHEAKMVEHRAAFGARTEADAKIIAGLREELDRVRNSLGIQAAKEANKVLGMVEGEGLRGAAERVVKERDGLLTQVQDMRVALAKEQELHAKTALRLSTEAAKLAQSKKGAWVKTTDGRVLSVRGYMVRLSPDREEFYDGSTCTPCDPPAADHDTPEGKQVAESVIRDDRKTEPDEIKVGDVAKVRSASGNLTAKCDVGQIGEVLKIDSRDGTVLLSGEAGWVDIQDVRKVTT